MSPWTEPRNDIRCTCGARMVMRYSAKWDSSFYGCERYPNCRNMYGVDAKGKPITERVGDAETEALRAKLRSKMAIWFDMDREVDREAFGHLLRSTVGLIKINDLNKTQIEKLLKAIGA